MSCNFVALRRISCRLNAISKFMGFTEELPTSEEEQIARAAFTGIAFGPRLIDRNGFAVFESSTFTLAKIFAQSGIETSRVNLGNKEADVSENAFELSLPVLVITSAYLSSDPNLVSLSINLIAAYIYDFFKGVRGGRSIRCKILIKDDHKVRKLTYSGPADDFAALKEVIETLKK